MAKHLILIRHAKSDWSFDVPDFSRPLNKRGNRDAPIMAKRLAAQKLFPEMLISSPANRAISTAKLFAKEMDYELDRIQEESAIYEAETLSLLKIVNSFDNQLNYIALFGHNPGVSLFAHYLCHKSQVDFPTCACMHLKFETDDWATLSMDTGDLVWFSYPKLV